MTAFLYYLPRANPSSDPREGKLAYAFEDKPVGSGVVRGGPDGGSGAVFLAASSYNGKIGYYPDKQEWVDVPYLGCWIGQYKDQPPTAKDLRRQKILIGEELSCRGQRWMVPIARSFQETNGVAAPVGRLSVYFQCDYETGEWNAGEVQEEYRDLWEVALKYWNFWFTQNINESADTDEELPEKINLEPGEVADMAVLALGTNYRVSKAEVSLLRLLSFETCRKILEIVIDLASFDAILKKNLSLAEGSSIDSGNRGETEDIRQLSSTG